MLLYLTGNVIDPGLPGLLSKLYIHRYKSDIRVSISSEPVDSADMVFVVSLILILFIVWVLILGALEVAV